MTARSPQSGIAVPAKVSAVSTRNHVAIVGGGFGGLYAARALGAMGVRVTLVDRRNFHLFQPLLYQVATGGLSPGDIASPLRAVLTRHVIHPSSTPRSPTFCPTKAHCFLPTATD